MYKILLIFTVIMSLSGCFNVPIYAPAITCYTQFGACPITIIGSVSTGGRCYCFDYNTNISTTGIAR